MLPVLRVLVPVRPVPTSLLPVVSLPSRSQWTADYMWGARVANMRVMGELPSWSPALAPLAVSRPRLAMGRSCAGRRVQDRRGPLVRGRVGGLNRKGPVGSPFIPLIARHRQEGHFRNSSDPNTSASAHCPRHTYTTALSSHIHPMACTLPLRVRPFSCAMRARMPRQQGPHYSCFPCFAPALLRGL